MMNCERRRLICLLILVGLCLPGSLNIADTKRQADRPQRGTLAGSNTYHYRMTGRVRLLLFWVGKEDVGGGSITFSDRYIPTEHLKAEGVKVLFGSNPRQVPGGINRWGYGEEWAYWRTSPDSKATELEYTVFTGFMRHSDEENLAQVFTSRHHELSDQLYWYDGLESVVRPGESVSETRHFSGSHELDYQEFSVVESAYEQRRDTGPPDKTEVLHNEARAYSTPYGFLTCLREVSRQISSQFENHREGFLREHYSGTYAYNAKTYVLEVIRLRYHSTFSVVDKGGNDTVGLSGLQFSDVAEAQFQLRNQADGSKHDFCLWFPLRGNLQGVPLRILDKPRWWLQVDLRLVNQ